MTESIRKALQGEGGGLQSISSTVSETIGDAIDTRGSSQKRADQASSELQAMSKSKGPTVPGSGVSADDQLRNQNNGLSDHLELGFRKS